MSADLDALDRGVIEAGVTAAEALARVAALEATVTGLRRQLVAVYRVGLEHGERRSAQRARLAELADGQPPARHLSAVPSIGGPQ
jgi:hypothetical protein